jgi:predicted HicB family RNase H-like nuclease
VSARIDNTMHEALRERCNKVGCSINEYLKASIELALTSHSEFDFEIEEELDDEI